MSACGRRRTRDGQSRCVRPVTTHRRGLDRSLPSVRVRRASTTDDDAPSLRRGHANLLCIVFRLSNVTSEDVTLSIPQHTIKIQWSRPRRHTYGSLLTDRYHRRDADRPTDGRARRRLGVRRGGRRGRGRWDRFVPSFGGGSAVDRASRRREGWGFDVIIIIIIIGRVSRAWEMRHVSGCPEATRAVVVGDADGYVRWCDGDGDDDERGMTCRLDVTSVTRIDANGGSRRRRRGSSKTDATHDDGDAAVVVAEIGTDGGGVWTTGAEWGGEVTLIAVGGAAVASCSAGRASGGGRDAARSVFSAFRALGSTALGVVKTAFVDASAPLDEDAVVYEGEDLDAVSSLRLEKATWNAAFVDAPRRFLRVASSPPPFDFFAVSDVAHRVLLFRLIGTKALRLTAVIKGCRDASFCFHPRSGLLALHRPSVRRPRRATLATAPSSTPSTPPTSFVSFAASHPSSSSSRPIQVTIIASRCVPLRIPFPRPVPSRPVPRRSMCNTPTHRPTRHSRARPVNRTRARAKRPTERDKVARPLERDAISRHVVRARHARARAQTSVSSL